MNVQVRHDVAGIFSTKEDAERRRFLELFTVLKSMEQVAKVVLHGTVFEMKNCQPIPGQDRLSDPGNKLSVFR